MVRPLKNNRGQTFVEYLMLMSVAFITAYIMITGPVAKFTVGMINSIKSVTGNVVNNAELSGDGLEAGSGGHPSDPARLRPLHL